MPDGSSQSIHLPLTPEYLGYADSGLSEEFFTATRPEIELLEDKLDRWFEHHFATFDARLHGQLEIRGLSHE